MARARGSCLAVTHRRARRLQQGPGSRNRSPTMAGASARSSRAARSSRTGSGRRRTTAPTSSAMPAPATSGSGSPTDRSTTTAPFATGAFGLSDMTFGFDANGRMVLYYVAIGGGLRKITPTTPAASSARNDLRMIPVTPFRAYDTGPNEPAVGVAPGKVFNGTTRRIDLHPPGVRGGARQRHLRQQRRRRVRPVVGHAGAATGDVVAQRRCRQHDRRQRRDRAARRRRPVHARVDDHGPHHRRRHGVARRHGRSGERGRFVALAPQRLVDTRIPAGTTLESGSDNPFTRSAAATSSSMPTDGSVCHPTARRRRSVARSAPSPGRVRAASPAPSRQVRRGATPPTSTSSAPTSAPTWWSCRSGATGTCR